MTMLKLFFCIHPESVELFDKYQMVRKRSIFKGRWI